MSGGRVRLSDFNSIPAATIDTTSIVTAEEFAAIEEPGSEPLLGDDENKLIAENSNVMVYGDGGAGKTTLTIDLSFHFAAGGDWLTMTVRQRVRVLVVENEGPRALFRGKVRRKLAAWAGSPIDDRLLFWEEPWADFTFADETHRQTLAAVIREREADVVVVGPLTASGMLEAGTLQQVREFTRLLDEVRLLAGRHVTFILVHHEGKNGTVSGAWEGCGDTLLHVQAQGHGRTRLYVQKARWASEQHGTTLQLLWADGESFTLEEKPELDDDAIADLVLEYIGEHAGTAWGKAEVAITGVRKKQLREIRDGLFAAGKIVNVARVDGVEVLLAGVQERRTPRLYLADDPTLAHLHPTRDAAGTQSASPMGAGGSTASASCVPSYKDAGVDAVQLHPQSELSESQFDVVDEDEVERLAELAQRCVQTACKAPREPGSLYCRKHGPAA